MIRFIFANAPVNFKEISMHTFYNFAATYALKKPVALNIRLPKQKPRDVAELEDLCVKHNILDLYLWLSYRFPKYFIERDICLQQKQHAISLIDGSLLSTNLLLDHDHGYLYRKARKRLMLKNPELLPPIEWGNVHKSTQQFLSQIPEEKKYRFLDAPNAVGIDNADDAQYYHKNKFRSNHTKDNNRAKWNKSNAAPKPFGADSLSISTNSVNSNKSDESINPKPFSKPFKKVYNDQRLSKILGKILYNQYKILSKITNLSPLSLVADSAPIAANPSNSDKSDFSANPKRFPKSFKKTYNDKRPSKIYEESKIVGSKKDIQQTADDKKQQIADAIAVLVSTP